MSKNKQVFLKAVAGRVKAVCKTQTYKQIKVQNKQMEKPQSLNATSFDTMIKI